MTKKSTFKDTIKSIYLKLFKIDDTPQKIALGMALGVFCGVVPLTGPLAALFLSFIFKANRAAALLGSLITNTWLAIATFVLAIKVGSVILKLNWHQVMYSAAELKQDFSWGGFLKLSLSEVILPLTIGYLIIGLVLGAFVYLISVLIARRRLKWK